MQDLQQISGAWICIGSGWEDDSCIAEDVTTQAPAAETMPAMIKVQLQLSRLQKYCNNVFQV